MKGFNVKKLLALLSLAVALGACTKIETGEVGLRKDYSGTVETEPVGVGLHGTLFSSVLVFSAKEVLVPVKGLHPITADKLPMEDVDIQFTYSVVPSAIPTLYTKYSASYHIEENGDIYPMRGMVEQFVRSAVSDAIAKYPALQVNDKRAEITGLITQDVQAKLAKEGLDKEVTVGQIVFTNVSIPAAIVASTQAAVQAQNDLKTAQIDAQKKVAVAQGEADAKVLAAQGQAKAIGITTAAINAAGGDNYIRLKTLEQWDGHLPQVNGSSAVPFLGNLQPTK